MNRGRCEAGPTKLDPVVPLRQPSLQTNSQTHDIDQGAPGRLITNTTVGAIDLGWDQSGHFVSTDRQNPRRLVEF